jgi:RNA polymerase sigma factor for flagellar operon FliA
VLWLYRGRVLNAISFLIGLGGIAFACVQWRQGKKLGEQVANLSGLLTEVLAERARPEQVATVEQSVGLGGVSNAQLAEAIARLPEREKLVVTLYYYEELSLSEIAEVLGVSESRASQIHTKAVLRLKAWLTS